jgi:hypothetical protein
VGRASWLDEVALSLENDETLDAMERAEGALYVRLHPAADPIEFADEGEGMVRVMAQTSAVGPGYHLYLCRLLKQLAEDRDIEWSAPALSSGETGDPTGAFFGATREAVETELSGWLQRLAGLLLEDERGAAVGMPPTHAYRFDGFVATPLGPRSREWLETVRADPSRGHDIFPWWGDGIDAEYLLRRALCRMWSDIRWREPVLPTEQTLFEETVRLLERAFELDPHLPFPTREWAFLHGLAGTGSELPAEIARLAGEAKGPLIGYRRQPVRVRAGGAWVVEIPGEFAEEWTDDGAFSAWHEGRTLLFRASHALGSAAELCEHTGLGERHERHDDHLHSVMYLGRVEGEVGEQGQGLLKGRVAVDGTVATVEISYPLADGSGWALDAWRAISYGS